MIRKYRKTCSPKVGFTVSDKRMDTACIPASIKWGLTHKLYGWLFFIFFFSLCTPGLYAQVKIGDNPTVINPNSLLELESNNRGLLLPRLGLDSTTSPVPLLAHIQGMVVYNTAVSGTGASQVTPGFYYNDGTRWVKVDAFGSDIVTTLDSLGLGVYRYINEAGDSSFINVLADVIANYQTILGDTNVANYLDSNIVQTVIDNYETILGDSVVAHYLDSLYGQETLTTLDSLGQGVYVYTSEDSTQTTIDVVGDVVDNFGDILSDTSVSNLLDNHIVQTVIDNHTTILGDTAVDNYLDANIVQTVIDNHTTILGDPAVDHYLDSNIVSVTDTLYWKLKGNSGTNSATNFIGTTDNVSLRFRTGNSERMVIDSTGKVGIGTNLPSHTLHVKAAANPLRVEGLQQGSLLDNIMTIDSTGLVRRISPTIYMADLRVVGSSHITQDAGIGGVGTAIGGSNHVAIGQNTLANPTSLANGNVAIGMSALQNAQNGSNVAVGVLAGSQLTGSSNSNVTVGASSLNALTNGSSNVAIGLMAGVGLTAGDDNIFIGRQTAPNISTTGSNQLNIGNWIYGDNGKIGIGVAVPSHKLHVVAAADPIRLQGLQTSVSSTDKLVVADTNGVLKTIKYVPGVQQNGYLVKGTTALTIPAGTSADVPGVTVTHTVPAGVTAQTLFFTVVGYAVKNVTTAGSHQGVFELHQNGVKVTSGFVSVATGDGASTPLLNLPIPVTMIHSVTLPPGTYTFKVVYSAWASTGRVNFVPSAYSGYNGDNQAMLTRMRIDVYNN